MYRTCMFVAVIFFAASTTAEERVSNSAGFESGEIKPNSSRIDGGFIKTLPDPQKGQEVIKSGRGGCGPKSNCDMRVQKSETVDGQVVTPRSGEYYLRMRLDKSKNYRDLNSGKPKPRNALSFTHDEYRFDHDVEEWIGFSVFLPQGFEDETETIGLILSEISTDSSAQFLKLSVGMRQKDKTSHWYFHYRISDKSVTNAEDILVDLGSIEPDKGKWTDFVVRVRSNPFKEDTNPAKKGIPNAKDRLYKGNKGILQVWKAEGGLLDDRGNRRMVNKIDKVNTPMGLVPGTVQGKSKIAHSIRAYKGGWQGNRGQETSVKGPIWIAWDEVRFGETSKHGTSYQDVHPTGMACTDRCPEGSLRNAAAPPAPPSSLTLQTSS